MATIPADTRAFFARFEQALSSVTGQKAQQVCKDLGLSQSALKSVFSDKGKNLQAKWDDAHMERFNAGNPNPNEVALLVSALLWGSKITESLKARGIERAAFEQACQQAVQSSPAAASGDLAACYLVMCKVAEDLKAQAADSGQHVSNICRAVAEVACHFHGKLIHSAAESGALLRTTRSTKPLPYLYSDHFEHLALDFFPNGVPAAATCRKAYALLQQARAGKSLSQDDAELAQAFEAAVQELGSGEQRSRNRFVDPVLRQLKIPKAGGYVVITPLACPAISFEIAGWQQNASAAGLRRVPEVSLLYGGSNIQNVTSMSETRQVLVFDVPSIEVNARVIALSVIHKGWRVPLKEMTPDLAAHIEHVRKNRWLDDRDSHLAQKIEMADGAALRSAVRLAITDWRATAQAMQEALQDDPDLLAQAQMAAPKHGPLVQAMLQDQLDCEALEQAIRNAIVSYFDFKAQKERDLATYLLSEKERARLADVIKKLVQAEVLKEAAL